MEHSPVAHLKWLMLSIALFGRQILQVQYMLTCSLHPDVVDCCVQSTTAKSASPKVLIPPTELCSPSLASHNKPVLNPLQIALLPCRACSCVYGCTCQAK